MSITGGIDVFSLKTDACVLRSSDLEKAAGILDPLEMNPESEANWKILAKIAIEE